MFLKNKSLRFRLVFFGVFVLLHVVLLALWVTRHSDNVPSQAVGDDVVLLADTIPIPSETVVGKIVLLGTAAGPVPRPGRSQPATLFSIGGRDYLIDAGDNVSQQLSRAQVSLTDLDVVFISHLHFDHVLGLNPLMGFTWTGARKRPLVIWGPPGTKSLVQRNISALEIGAEIFRSQLPPRPEMSDLFEVKEISEDGPVAFYEDEFVKVTAVSNTHYEDAGVQARDYGLDQSYSYRFDTDEGSVVFTGDTGPSEALEVLAMDVDLLVSEIIDLPSVLSAVAKSFGGNSPQLTSLQNHLKREHLTAEEVGKLAARSNAGRLLITHFAIGPNADVEAFVSKIRKYYPEGEIILGQDLMSIPLDGN
ncbi:MAG: MBL fold metallo-hydrolase [Robiginitomaculum sp.]|nr:MAG: MBL fold metallo-hydrolase [Robiginitomaculum sp.]